MTIKDILEKGFGIDFNTLNFDLKESATDTTAEEIKKKLGELELQFSPETECSINELVDVVDFDVWGDTISLYDV